MTDARARTLSAEVLGAPSPAARSVRLAVEVLMSNPLPITVTPQAGHLRITGHAPVYARARTLNAEVMSVGTPGARARRLAVEAMFSVVEASGVTQPGHLALSGHTPTIEVTNYPVTVTLLGVEVLGQESSTYLPTQIAEPNSSQINIAARRWPMGLPGPLVDNYGVEMQDTSLRSAMDTGPGKVRPRFSAASSYVTVNWRMDRTQLQAFHDWYVGTLHRGALSFLWPDPWTKPYRLMAVDPGHTHNGVPVNPNVNGCCPQHPWIVLLSGDAGETKAYEMQYNWMTTRFRKLNPYKPVGGTKVLESNVPVTPTLSYSSLALVWEVSAELEILP